MKITNTSEYLQALDDIASIIESRPIDLVEKKRLKLLMTAAKQFEQKALQQEPAKDRIIQNFLGSKFLLN